MTGSDPVSKLALGTVQFGLDYGVSNRKGVTHKDEVREILSLASSSGVKVLDTAPVYGNAQKVLGGLKESLDFQAVTKIPLGEKDPLSSLERSLEDLKIQKVHGVMFHGSKDLLEPDGERLWDNLLGALDMGLAEKIGVSLYDPDEALSLLDRYDMGLVQFPMNLLDQRFRTSGVLEILKKRKIEVHVRSCFLQGLLLMDIKDLDPYFKGALEALEFLKKTRESQGATALEAALGFVFSFKEADKVVVGVNSKDHLKEILSALRKPLPEIPPDWRGLEDKAIINPSFWPKGVGR